MLESLEDLPKLVELGALGLINLILVFKGIDKMQNLTNSVKELSDAITANIKTLTDNVTKLQAQTEIFNHRFEIIENRISHVEEYLRDIKFNIEHNFSGKT